ncbi:Colicin I receptor precursor [compost metagenome]
MIAPSRTLLSLAAATLPLIASPALAKAPQGAAATPLLDEVVVTGTRTERRLADTPVATEVITRSEIEASGAVNVADLLMSRTGIEVFSALQGEGIRLQGLDSKHVLILVDGRRITGRLSGTVDLTRFPIESIERVEIVRGGSSALYGSEAMAGVVNLITRQAKKPLSFETQGLYGSLNTGVFSGTMAHKTEIVDTRITAGWRRQDAYDLTPSTPGTTGNSLNEVTLSNNSSFTLSRDLQVKTHLDYFNRIQQGIDSSATGAIFDRTNNTESLSAAIEPEFTLPGLANLKVTAYYNHYRDQYLKDQRNSNALDQYEQTIDQLTQLQVQDERALGLAHILTSGAEVAYERLSTDRLNAAYGDRVRAALYTQDEWQALPSLLVLPGLRADLDSRYGTNLAPKVALRYDPTQTVTLRASLGTGFRAPDFKELMMQFQNVSAGYEVVGNPNLNPETSSSLNVGLETRLTSWAWLGANLYQNEIANLIQTELARAGTADTVTQYRYVNVASAMTRGVEASLRIQAFKGLILEPGYTLNDTLDRSTGLQLEGRSLHKGTLTARYQHDPWGLGLYVRGALNGERPFHSTTNGVTSTTMAPAYTTLEARLTKSITQQLSAHVQGTNLLNIADPVYTPMQPLTVLAGLTARF